MLIRIALVLIAMVASTTLAAQNGEAISTEEWREILGGVAVADDNAILGVATQYSKESTDLVSSGAISTALHKSIISLVLTRQVFGRRERRGDANRQRDIDSQNSLQTALISAGVSQDSITQSAAQLGIYLRENPSSMIINTRATPRVATTSERLAMIKIVKENLLDPNSPIYGRADIVGDRACLTVNAKNSFGGYAGRKEALFYFDWKVKSFTGGHMLNIQHDTCLGSSN